MTESEQLLVDQHVAVIGLAGRFPGANDPEEFWRNIAGGVESIHRLSEDELRWAGVDETTFRDPGYVPYASDLDDVDLFDAEYFGMTPLEAAVLDPQQRLLLENTQHLFDNAGYDPSTLTAPVGVYVGVGFPSYLVHNLLPNPEILQRLGMHKIFYSTDKGFAPTRISYKFGLTGPSIGVDTACSTSLVAVHQACRALLAFDCDLAVAGGASVALPRGVGYEHIEGGIASPDGHCRAFDAQAGGTLFGSGVGLVLLKRLDEAVAAGDHIHAVILGSAVNNDGAAKAGFTAPSVPGQAAVIAEALAFAQVPPGTVGYVEAHGTGTAIGDPIEIAGLTRAYREHTERTGFCAIGSVKTNVGHLDVAAGVSGLIKTVLALRQRQLPPSLHYRIPNPAIDFANSPFYVSDTLRPWDTVGPRRAGVSSFGIGGTNAHVILEQAPPRPPAAPARTVVPLVVSARSADALKRACADLAAVLTNNDLPLADVAYTLSIGRRHHQYRRAIVADDNEKAVAELTASATAGQAPLGDTTRVAFVFPGQGDQRVEMLAGLYRDEPVFRATMNRCAEHGRTVLGVDVRDVLYPPAGTEDSAQARLDETLLTQPVLFAVCLALADLWQSWGVRPDVVLGHSFGEYVAATVAGVFTPEEGLELVISRAQLTSQLPPGAMVAVTMPEADLVHLLGACELATVNGPDQCVVTGPVPAVEALERLLDAREVEYRRLNIPHAFHSAALDPILDRWRRRVAGLRRSAPRIPVVSSHTGAVLTAAELADPDYWARQLRGTVRFADAVATVAATENLVFLEVGPVRTLAPLIRRNGVEPRRIACTGTGRREFDSEETALLAAVGALHCAGVPLSWNDFWGTQARQRVPLPGYPFDRGRHWIDPAGTEARTHFAPAWRPAPLPTAPDMPGTWLLVGEAPEQEYAWDMPWLIRTVPDLADIESYLAELDAQHRAPAAIVLRPDDDPLADNGIRLVAEWIAALTARGQSVPLVVLAADSATAGWCRVAAAAPTARELACVDTTDPAQVRAEIAAGLPDPVVRYRDDIRQVATFTPVAAPGEPTVGAYTVVGDVEGPSADVARALAARSGDIGYNPGLTLTVADTETHVVLPHRDEWSRWVGATGEQVARAAAGRAITAAPATARLYALEQVHRDLDDARAAPSFDRVAVAGTLDRLCGALVYRTLVDSGVDLTPGRVHQRAEISVAMNLRPAFERFLDFFLTVLTEDGVLRSDGEHFTVIAGPEMVGGTDPVAARQLIPGFEPTLDFIEHCAHNYPAALSGRIDAVGVLFPDGSPQRLEHAFARMLEGSNYHTYAALLGRLLAGQADARPDQPLRILEVGGGNGQLTTVLAAALRGRDIHYTFTDLGGSFVRRARQRGGEYGFSRLRCQVFDISRDPAEQGIDLFAFDAVIGFDVVHATPRLDVTVANLRDVLAPGGVLCLVEAVRSMRWVEMLWGLAEGWWLFEDTDVRTGTPLVGLDTWDTVLRRQGLAEVVSFPRDDNARAATDYGLILGHQLLMPNTPRFGAHLDREGRTLLTRVRRRIELVRELEALGVRATVVPVDEVALDPADGASGIVHILEPLPGDLTPAELCAALRRQDDRIWSLRAEGAHVSVVALFAPDGGPGLVPMNGGDDFGTVVHWDGTSELGDVVRALGHGGTWVVAQHNPGPAVAAKAQTRITQRQDSAGSRTVPDDEVEHELLTLFRQLFGMDTVGLHDDFQQLGGDSLLATQVIARVRRTFAIDIAVSALFHAPTVAGLADKVRAARQAGTHTDIPLERVTGSGPLSLSLGQQSLWLSEQINGPSPTYNIPGAVRLIGALDVDCLGRALREVLRRHEILTATVDTVDGEPLQRIHEDRPLDLPVRVVAENEVHELAQEHARTVFDLRTGPLIRVALLRVGDAHSDHVLLVNIHHIVSDGWSLGVLVHEVITLYAAYTLGTEAPLPPLPHQYVDFAHWQRRWLTGDVFDEQARYWRRKLAGASPLLELPTDRPRPDVQRIRGAVHRFEVPPDLAAQVHDLGRAEGATLFMVLLSAFTVVLGRYADTEDVVVGTTSANRTRAAFEQMIGMFVNNLVLRTDLTGRPTFRQLLARVRATAVEAYAHQDLPFLTLVDELRVPRSAAHPPLFQVLFLVQKLNISLELPGIAAHTMEVDALHTKFDLTLFMEEQDAGPDGAGITGTFIYNAALFDASSIERMAAHLTQLLRSAMAEPDERIGALSMDIDDEVRLRTLTESTARSTRLQSLRSSKRRSVTIAGIDPVDVGFLPGLADAPAVLSPTEPGVDLPGWLRAHAARTEELLHKHGAVLLRGFDSGSVERFEAVASAICPSLFSEYGDLPPEGKSDQIYKSTPYPEDRSILFHNESSHLPSWPMRQFFSCIVAPKSGGETPIVDCRKVFAALRPELVAMFRDRKLRYVRNFIKSVDVSWSQFYGTDDPQEAERKIIESGADFAWAPDGTLRTWRVADAVLRHPRTAESVFFNQLALHHVSCLDPATRQSLLDLYSEQGLPRNVYWGDGTPIDDEIVTEVRELMHELSFQFIWQEGDILVIDNMLVAHSRNPFSGPRKVVVALGDMMNATDAGLRLELDVPTIADAGRQ